MFGQAIVTAETILAIMRQIRMRKISWRMTCCYYPTWWQSHSARPHYTLLEKLDVFSLCSSRATYHSHPRHSSFSRTAPATPTVRRVSSSGQPSVCVCLTVSINLSLHTRKFWNLIPFMYSCKEFTTENFQNDTRGEEKKKTYVHHPLQTEPQEWFFKTKIYYLSSERYVWRMNIKRVKLRVIKFYGYTSLVCKGSVLRIIYWMRENRHVWFTGECTLNEMKHTFFSTQIQEVADIIFRQQSMHNW